MAEVATKITDFTSTGRTGRRNALPDILDVGTTASGDDLVVRLDSLALDEKGDTASGGAAPDGGQASSDGTSSSSAKTELSESEGS
ncbi:cAMP-dependent protein kinase inhibitor beta-like [Asterias rubens]|uniref:cAMP-dependent protein kinase inhibitor beta-like n=1 Tax=Asterias rubens TaxID=7604 RepID=UPI001455456A|nr:cAMP-dependent protein kinase inhibitor beta-like [Asterias rubens]